MGKGLLALGLLVFSVSAGATENLSQSILRDIRARSGSNFLPLIEKWQDQHGARAVPELLALARNSRLDDSTRYIALIAATKIGGQAAAEHLYSMLDDRVWMIRSAALRGLILIKPANPTRLQEKALLDTLRDKALVVRREAVQAIRTLKPRGSVAALVAAAGAKENYVQGRAQWIPQSALEALSDFRTATEQLEIRESISGLARTARDPAIRAAASKLERSIASAAIPSEKIVTGASAPQRTH